jgi:hypothetical protein
VEPHLHLAAPTQRHVLCSLYCLSYCYTRIKTMPSKWVPLEASPDVSFATHSHLKLTYLGVQRCMSILPVPHAANEKWSNPIGLPSGPLSFQDLFSLDPEFLQFIPKPVKAVLLLFPCRGELAEARKKEEDGEGKFTGDVWWIKQTVSLSYLYLS